MASSNKKRLQELGDSNYEIVDGQPDIRGWDVKNVNGKKFGEVDELIIDTQSRKVRYIVVDLEDNDWDLDDRDVLIPIGLAELHEKDDDVILRNVSAEQIKALPEYDDENIDSNFESTIRNVFISTRANITGPILSNTASSVADFYAHEHFNDNLQRNRSTTTSFEEYVRMRQEPSFLEREGSIQRDIDDDIDEMREESIEMEERDAIPVADTTSRSGNDYDEWDLTHDDTPPLTDTDIERSERNREDREEWRNRSTDL